MKAIKGDLGGVLEVKKGDDPAEDLNWYEDREHFYMRMKDNNGQWTNWRSFEYSAIPEIRAAMDMLQRRTERRSGTGDRRTVTYQGQVCYGRRHYAPNLPGGLARIIPASLNRRAVVHVYMRNPGRRRAARSGRRAGDVR